MTPQTMDIIIDTSGQDRPRLAELSLCNGSEFHGTAHRSPQFNTWQLMLPNDRTWTTVRVATGAGLRLCIDPRAEDYCWCGLHEPRVQGAVSQHLAPGSLVWEVGAHIGFVSAIAARTDSYESKPRAVS